jgi:hypothetical protein
MAYWTAFALAVMASVLSACGGGDDSAEQRGQSSPAALAPGSRIALPPNSSVLVPAGTTVTTMSNTVTTVNGSANTVYTTAGATVDVPAGASGTASNVVTDVLVEGARVPGAVSITLLAGSELVRGAPVDGIGAAAVFWGGGQLAADPGGNLIVSDRGALRRVTRAGQVTTVVPAGQPYDWEGVAVDAGGNVFGSGNDIVGSTPPMRGVSTFELPVSGAPRFIARDWTVGLAGGSSGAAGVVADSLGNLFAVDGLNNQIVRFTPDGRWSVLAGSGAVGNADGAGTAATFSFAGGQAIAIDGSGNLYVRSGDRVRSIAADGTVTTVAAGLAPGSNAIAVDARRIIYSAGYGALYRIDSNGAVTAYPAPFQGELVTALAVAADGSLYAETGGSGVSILTAAFAE